MAGRETFPRKRPPHGVRCGSLRGMTDATSDSPARPNETQPDPAPRRTVPTRIYALVATVALLGAIVLFLQPHAVPIAQAAVSADGRTVTLSTDASEQNLRATVADSTPAMVVIRVTADRTFFTAEDCEHHVSVRLDEPFRGRGHAISQQVIDATTGQGVITEDASGGR